MQSVVILVLAWLICFIVGYGTTYFVLPHPWKDERLHLAPIVGAGSLILLAAATSYLGLPMSIGYLPASLAGLGISTAGLLKLRRSDLLIPSGWRISTVLVLLGVLGAACALLSIVLYHAWDPYTDAFTYFSIADYLKDHSYFVRALPGNDHPVLTQMRVYQDQGFRMGSNFLLAYFTSLFHEKYSFDLYIPVLSLGIWLAVPGFWLFSRRVLAMPRFPATVATGLYALDTAIPVSNALSGFLPQTWGIVFLYPALSFYVRGTTRASQKQMLPVAGAFLGLMLLCYSEIVPFALLMVWTVYITRSAFGRLPVRTASICAGIPVLMAALTAPVATWWFLAVILSQLKAVVGWDVHLSLFDYVGVLTGFRSMTVQWPFSSGLGGALVRLAASISFLTAVLGLPLLRRNIRWQLARLAFPFLLALILFTFFSHNPWNPSEIGQPWSTYKVVTYGFFLFIASWALALCRLWWNGGTQRFVAIAQIVAIALYFPIASTANARWASQGMREFTGGAPDPVKEYKRIPAVLTDWPANEPVNLVIPTEALKHRQIVAYFLRRPVLADWSDDAYIWPHLDRSKGGGGVNPRFPTLLYTPTSKKTAVADLTLVLPDASFASADFGAGWYDLEKDNQNTWHWLEEKGDLDLTVSGKGGSLTLKTDLAVVGAPSRNLTISVPDRPDLTRTYRVPKHWFAPFTTDQLTFSPGRYHLVVTVDGPPYKFPTGDPRVVRAGFRNLTAVIMPN